MRSFDIDVPIEELVSRNFTVTPVAENNKDWIIRDDQGEVVDDIRAVFQSVDGSGNGYGCASLKFTLMGDGWSWDFKSRGRNRIPGIQFCSRPRSRRVQSEFQSYIDDDNGQILYVDLDPKHKETGEDRVYQFCWVARLNGLKFKSADPMIIFKPD